MTDQSFQLISSHVINHSAAQKFPTTIVEYITATSCFITGPVIPQFGNDPIREELPKSWRPFSRMKLVPTRTSNEVPVLFREIYINRGFRAPYQCWRYYLLSFFQLHNESMNVWTHFIATFLMARKIFLFRWIIVVMFAFPPKKSKFDRVCSCKWMWYDALSHHVVSATALSHRTARPSIVAMSSLFGLSLKTLQFAITWPRSDVAAPHIQVLLSW